MKKYKISILILLCCVILTSCNSGKNFQIEGTEKSPDIEPAIDYVEGEEQASNSADDSECYPGIIYNEVCTVDTVSPDDTVTGFHLTEEELEMVLPDMLLDWMQPSATAFCYEGGELAYVSIIFPSSRWNGQVEVTVQNAGEPVYSDIFVEDTEEVARFGNIEYTASQFVDSEDETALLWIIFEREGIRYRIFANTSPMDMEYAKADIHNVLQLYAETETVPDLDVFILGDGDTDTGVSSPLDGVTMEVIECSDTSVTVRITNDTDKDIQCGSDFCLKIQDEETGEWWEMEAVIDNFAFTAEAYTIQRDSPYEKVIDFEWLYGKLEPGRYRIVKTVMDVRGTGDHTDYIFTADFKI